MSGRSGGVCESRTRPIGASEDGLQVRSQKDVERPATCSGGRGDEAHVNVVEIRTRLSIKHDGDEVAVEDVGDLI